MRSVPVLAAVIVGAIVISGCGQQHQQPGGTGQSAGGSAGASSGGASGGSSSGSPGGVAGGGVATVACRGGTAVRGRSVTITGSDSGKVLCVARGTKLTVFLKGTANRKWTPIKASPGVLQPSANGEFTLALGETGASFLAAAPGTAAITSSRPVCGQSAAGSSTLSCDALLAFRVTIKVTR